MTTVRITYGARPNKRPGAGHLPLIWVDGVTRGCTWWPTGQSEGYATALAHSAAVAESRQYSGDVRLSVEFETDVEAAIEADALNRGWPKDWI